MYSPRAGGGAFVGALAATGAAAAPLTALVVLAVAAVLIGGFCVWRTARLRAGAMAGRDDRP